MTAGNARILLVEDTLPLARAYQEYLAGEPYDIMHVAHGEDAIRAVEEEVPAAVILDLQLPDMNGIEVLKHIHGRGLPCAVVVVTANGSVNVAVAAMREGAVDFLVKPFTAERLIYTLRNALEHRRLSRIVETYQTEIDRGEYHGFVGASLAMQAVYRTIDSAATSKATIFICGESGTGKEICAEAIHRQSPRRERAFVALNCAAIPHELIESEIFGHVKGAYTGAVGFREGAAARADGGTLFLDEICEMPLDLQVKLLRFIQTGTFTKVGGSELEKVDVRFVCATNRDPLREVEEGRFREDLYYRLHVIPIHMPPLREREDDVLRLAEHFLLQFSKEEGGRRFRSFAPAARAAIALYEWPGNVRQLQNVIRNVVVLNDGEVVERGMLPEPLSAAETGSGLHRFGGQQVHDVRRSARSHVPQQIQASQGDSPVIRPLAVIEREAIETALEAADGNVPRAAAMLDISPSTIYRKISRWEEDGQGKSATG